MAVDFSLIFIEKNDQGETSLPLARLGNDPIDHHDWWCKDIKLMSLINIHVTFWSLRAPGVLQSFAYDACVMKPDKQPAGAINSSTFIRKTLPKNTFLIGSNFLRTSTFKILNISSPLLNENKHKYAGWDHVVVGVSIAGFKAGGNSLGILQTMTICVLVASAASNPPKQTSLWRLVKALDPNQPPH